MANKKKNGGGKGGKQTQLPGTERKDRNMEIENAASKYVEVRDDRMKLTAKEVEAQEALLAAMKKAKLSTYICDTEELEVEVVPEGEKAKVRRRKVEEAATT